MVALPFSEALISISGVLLFLVSLFYIKKTDLKHRISEGKYLLLFSSVYIVYVVGILFCNDQQWGIYDLQKNIPYIIIPLAFFFYGKIETDKLKKLLLIFASSVLLAGLITMISFYLKDQSSVLDAQESGFIHHIRFSFQVILAIVLFVVILLTNEFGFSRLTKFGLSLAILFLLIFLIWHQSLTGIFTFMGTAMVGILLFIRKIKIKLWRNISLGIILILILTPTGYVYYAVEKYYDIDEINTSTLDKKTSQGNEYYHDLNNKLVENGHYVGLYWCEKEMEEAWNKRADLKYNEFDKNEYQVKSTLIRYLTSKNLRKDAEGVNELTDEDIKNIESGISNYILANKGLSLYPRIYVSIWELDTYFKTGQANQKSLAQRIEYVKAALTIIKDNFWFGVGTGNWKSAYREAYQENNSQMDPARYGDAHNQYLNYWVKFGLIGLLWILFVIIYPVVKSKSYKNPVFFLFLTSMLFANFGDSNFETHVGSSYFVLMYCLFLTAEKWEIGIDNKLTQ